MKRTIVITDLTRFTKPEKVCTAGIDVKTGECIRPLPYFTSEYCRRTNLLPGTLLEGDFTPMPDRSGPHQEDNHYRRLLHPGALGSAQFRNVLAESCSAAVGAGFEITFARDQKVLPADHPVRRSIITVAVPPSGVKVVEDGFRPGKIKLHFRDQRGGDFSFIGITDLGFHDYAMRHHERNDLASLNRFIQTREEVFLRIGLSRAFQASDGRQGFWLQVNGIYTFPHLHEGVRGYS